MQSLDTADRARTASGEQWVGVGNECGWMYAREESERVVRLIVRCRDLTTCKLCDLGERGRGRGLGREEDWWGEGENAVRSLRPPR